MNAPSPSPDPPLLRRASFRLTRFFSIISLVGIALVTAALIWTYRELGAQHLVEHETRANADLTRAFANAVWGRYRHFVAGAKGRSREALLADPEQAQLRADVLGKMRGLQIVKVKIYDLDGLTVFSTDDKQIGEDKSANAGFRQARDGEPASQITFREKFDAFEGTLSNRNLMATYVPVRHDGSSAIEGVFEIYSDVTELLADQDAALQRVAGVVLGALTLLYVFLFFVVRKADRIIERQQAERAAQEAAVRHQAYHDALTGLPNRAYFAQRLQEALGLAARHGHTMGLMFIDLDRFKIVNDSLGHHAGDALLKVASARIRDCLRGSDLLFRMGGDEFTVILPEIAAPEDAAFVARRILESVAAPVAVHEHELVVGATIGIAVYPGDGDDTEALLKNADAAMYSAKAAGRGTHAFYRASMNQRALQRLHLEAALRRGFRDGEFLLHYQPRLDAATREVVAVEALMRWNSPSRGMVPPGDFIGVLEDTGQMAIVGEWALRTACAQLRDWDERGLPPLRMSVNMSSVQFQNPGLVSTVRRVLADSGVSPERLELELTESLLLDNTEQSRSTIDGLRALGVRISLDDFGTGYSSLNYLRRLQVDYLKIDRSFVTEIVSSERDRAVATAIVELADALRITVIAEGVETEEQAAFFSGIRCGELQGFLFCRPLPGEQVERFLAAHRPVRVPQTGSAAEAEREPA